MHRLQYYDTGYRPYAAKPRAFLVFYETCTTIDLNMEQQPSRPQKNISNDKHNKYQGVIQMNYITKGFFHRFPMLKCHEKCVIDTNWFHNYTDTRRMRGEGFSPVTLVGEGFSPVTLVQRGRRVLQWGTANLVATGTGKSSS